MWTRLPVLLGACVAALLTPTPGSAAAVPRACTGPSIRADADFREHHPELVERLRSELPAGAQVDACAVVDLRLASAAITVSVSLPDGRTAARDVARREDVLPTLQALLLVPEPGPAPAPAAVAEPAPAPARKSPAVAAAEPRSAVRDEGPTTATRKHGFELSLISGVRVGDGQFGYGAGVLSFIELRRWLVGFQGRVDGYRALQGSDPESALSLGLLFGRRFDFGNTALDLTAGPAVAMRGASFGSTDQVSVQAPPDASSSSRSPEPARRDPDIGPMPRLLLGARLGFSPRSVFRTFVGIDGELGPTHGADAFANGTAGRMPAYTVGLALGATVGTR
jgi:hypothetical protein